MIAKLVFSPRVPAVVSLFVGLMMVSAMNALTDQTGSAESSAAADQQPTVAFHYGYDAPLDTLRAFDIVVVEPVHEFDPHAHAKRSHGKSSLYAYVSIGEVVSARPYAALMPADMLAGTNPTWDSRIVNQAHPDWPAFFVDRVVAPLWEAGYRGFFVDTMDSYQAGSSDPDALKAQQDGLVRTIELLHQRFPKVQLMTNRGFELLPRIRQYIRAVAVESLFGRWDEAAKRYRNVPDNDRQWVLAQLREVQKAGLQAISIDYANPGDRSRTRELARQIQNLGITPYVTSGDLKSIGIGALEIVPRRVLMIHNSTPPGETEQSSTAHRMGVMPLQYLGYRVDLLDLHRYALPDIPLADRYAAVVGFFEGDEADLQEDLTGFISRALDEKVRVVLLNNLGVSPDSPLAYRLGFVPLERAPRAPVRVSYQAPKGVGDEIRPLPNTTDTAIRAPKGSTPLITLVDAAQQQFDGAAITPWGGYALNPYTYVPVDDQGIHRWVIDPISFMAKAIGGRASRPVPDVTTENGRRLLMIHIDGDGFASRAEVEGSPYAAEVMYRDFISRYKVPHTVSVIEGETGPTGLYPAQSKTLEEIARNIFKLPNVELASHSYSHPFYWGSVVFNAEQGNPSSQAEHLQHLPLKGYDFDLNRDIAGSVNYINERLAPPGKKAGVFLWTGDCEPPAAALRASYEAGLLNMNAGDTLITRDNPSLTLVAPMSIRKDGWLQVMAPNQNENVYTNNWTGPFYGFERVIETFDLTNAPRRIKPINIYYHTYSASKPSAIASLHRVYQYALKQPVNPVYSSEYIRAVHDFEAFTTARELRDDGREVWQLRGGDHLRTVRLPPGIASRINWTASTGIAGHKRGVDGTYIHLAQANVRLVIEQDAQPDPAHVVAANGRVSEFARSENGFEFKFRSHVTGRLTLAHAKACTVRVGGKPLKSLKRAAESREGLLTNDYRIQPNDASARILVSVSC